MVTDHNALVYIFGDDAAAPVTASGELRHGGRLMRWALQLAAYDFEMCHVPGTRMGIPDYLSRFASAAVTPLEATEIAGWFAHPWKRSWDLEKMTFLTIPTFPVLPQQQITLEFLLQLQRQDSILEAIREAVSTKDFDAAKGKLLAIYNSTRSLEQQAGHLPHNWKGIDLTRFEIGTGGLLFRRETKDATEEPFLQLVLPPQMRRAFLVEKHDGNHSGHPGSKRTFKKLWPKYWWPDMEAEVALL